jgi:hypothetical protein
MLLPPADGRRLMDAVKVTAPLPVLPVTATCSTGTIVSTKREGSRLATPAAVARGRAIFSIREWNKRVRVEFEPLEPFSTLYAETLFAFNIPQKTECHLYRDRNADFAPNPQPRFRPSILNRCHRHRLAVRHFPS